MEKLAIGKIGRVHGLKGYVKVKSFSGETDHFYKLEDVTVSNGTQESTYCVENVRSYKEGMLLMKFTGIDSPEKGSSLTNGVIWVPRELASPLSEGEYYLADLCTCSLVKDGVVRGTITAVCDGTNSELLEVRDDQGKMHLIPFIQEFIGDVDIERRTIEILVDWVT